MLDNPAVIPAGDSRAPELYERDAAFLRAHHDRIVRAVGRFLAGGHDPAQFALVIDVPPKDLLQPELVRVGALARTDVRKNFEKEFEAICETVERHSPPEGTMWLLLKMPDHTSLGLANTTPCTSA